MDFKDSPIKVGSIFRDKSNFHRTISLIIVISRKVSRMRRKNIGTIICIFLAVFTIFSQFACAAESEAVRFSLRRDFGTGFGNKIEGQFTLHGTGESFIIKLELYFNETLKISENDNDLTYSFETKGTVGMVNITLKGVDANGNWYTYSEVFEFLSSDINYITVPIVIGIVILALSIRFARYRKSKKEIQPKSPESLKKDINLSLDKDLL